MINVAKDQEKKFVLIITNSNFDRAANFFSLTIFNTKLVRVAALVLNYGALC